MVVEESVPSLKTWQELLLSQTMHGTTSDHSNQPTNRCPSLGLLLEIGINFPSSIGLCNFGKGSFRKKCVKVHTGGGGLTPFTFLFKYIYLVNDAKMQRNFR